MSMQYQAFSSCEEVAAILSDWDLDLRPLESGSAEIASAATEIADINLTSFSGKVHQVGATPAGHYTIGILITPDYPLRWNGYEVDCNRIEVFAPGEEYDSIGPGGFSALTVTVAEDTLDSLAETLGVAALRTRTNGQHWYGQPSPERLKRVKSRIQSHLHSLRSGGLEEDTLTELLLALTETDPKPQQPSQRWLVFKRAVALMNDLPAAESVSVGAICKMVGCSFSTLERAFREQTGAGPKSYLHRLRMNRVHAQLSVSGQPRITDIANQNGFWHMGKFAADYRQAFGELPSETALKAR